MKKISILWLSLKELKQNYFLLLISFLLLTSILTAAFFVSIASSNVVEAFFDYISSSSSDNGNDKEFSFTLSGLQYSAVDTISDMPFVSIIPDDISLVGSDFFYDGSDLDEYFIMAHYPHSELQYTITKGIPFTEDLNNSELIWISKNFSEETNCDLDNIIINRISSDITVEYTVAGIFESDFNSTDILVPFGTFYTSMEKNGLYIDTTMAGTISNIADYKKISAELKKRGVHASSGYDEELKVLTLMNVLLQALFVIVSVAGIWTFSNLCSIILNNRKGFIIHLQILGMKPTQTLWVYGTLIIAISAFALILAMIFTNFFSLYIIDFTKKLYPELGTMELSNTSQLIKGTAVFLITVFLVLIRAYKNIRCTELISQLSTVQ